MMFFRGFTDRSNEKMNNNQHHGRDEKNDPMNINTPNLKRNTHKNKGNKMINQNNRRSRQNRPNRPDKYNQSKRRANQNQQNAKNNITQKKTNFEQNLRIGNKNPRFNFNTTRKKILDKLKFPKLDKLPNNGRYRSERDMTEDLIGAIDYFNQKGKQSGMVHWTPDDTMARLYFTYLFHRYSVNCRPLQMEVKVDNLSEEEEAQELADINRNVKQIIKCIQNGSKLIVLDLIMTLPIEDYSHSNLIIIRPELKLIEYFEPHGKELSVSVEMQRVGKEITGKYLAVPLIVERFFNVFVNICNEQFDKKGIPRFDSRFADSTCPYEDGFQGLETESQIATNISIDGGGYCLLWSLFMVHMILLNPTRTIADIYRIIYTLFKSKSGITKRNDYFRYVAYGYSNFIDGIIKKYFSEYLSLGKDLTLEYLKLLQDDDHKDEYATFVNDLREYARVHSEVLMHQSTNDAGSTRKKPTATNRSIQKTQMMMNRKIQKLLIQYDMKSIDELLKHDEDLLQGTGIEELMSQIMQHKRIKEVVMKNSKKMREIGFQTDTSPENKIRNDTVQSVIANSKGYLARNPVTRRPVKLPIGNEERVKMQRAKPRKPNHKKKEKEGVKPIWITDQRVSL